MSTVCECPSYLLAGNTEVAPEILEQLSKSVFESVRRRVAENVHHELPIAIRLLKDKSTEVRIALTENTELLPYIAVDLSHDESSDVRYALAENYNTPTAVLEQLSLDENPYVASRALTTLERTFSNYSYNQALAA